MFERLHHQHIALLLGSLDAGLLKVPSAVI